MERSRRRTFVRVGLVALALPQLAIAVWALASPRGWFESFPGAGRAWLPLYGPYDAHLTRDVGATFLALGVLLLFAAAWTNRRVVVAALVAYLAYAIPHAIYHFGVDSRLGATDQALNSGALALSLVLAGALLVFGRDRAAHPRGPEAQASPGHGAVAGAGRLGPPPRGVLTSGARRYGRRRFGREPAALEAFLHHPRLMAGYATFETAFERSNRVDPRLKSLAELKAGSIVGCEWCLDFGSWLSRGHGVPEAQLRELPIYRESDAFSPVEKAVLDLADAMTRTPAEVPDELFARLREDFDDAQIVELSTAVAIENLRARFNQAVGLEPQGFADGGFCVIPEREATTA